MQKIFDRENLWRSIEFLEEYLNESGFGVNISVDEDEFIKYLISTKNNNISCNFFVKGDKLKISVSLKGNTFIKDYIIEGTDVKCEMKKIMNRISEQDLELSNYVRHIKIKNLKNELR